MIQHKPFYFLRHGETQWNKTARLMGQSDIPLNNRGVDQAYDLAYLLREIKFDYIFTSPLIRAFETAKIVQSKTRKPIFVMDEFKGCSWGVMEGKEKTDTSWYPRWKAGEITIEGAETYEQLTERILRGLREVLNFQGRAIIIGHGGGYSTIQKTLNLRSFHIPNCTPIYHKPPREYGESWTSFLID